MSLPGPPSPYGSMKTPPEYLANFNFANHHAIRVSAEADGADNTLRSLARLWNGWQGKGVALNPAAGHAIRWQTVKLLRVLLALRHGHVAPGDVPPEFQGIAANPRLSQVGIEIGSTYCKMRQKHLDIDWFGPPNAAGRAYNQCNWWQPGIDGAAEELRLARALLNYLERSLGLEESGTAPDTWGPPPGGLGALTPLGALSDPNVKAQVIAHAAAHGSQAVRLEWWIRNANGQNPQFTYSPAVHVGDGIPMLRIESPDCNPPDRNYGSRPLHALTTFQPGPAGGARYIKIERTGPRFVATDHFGAPGTRAPLVFVPAVALEPTNGSLRAEFVARVTAQGGRVQLVAGPDPTGVTIEKPARDVNSPTYMLRRIEAETVTFMLRLPLSIVPSALDIFSASCTAAFSPGEPRAFPVDLSGLPEARPVPDPRAPVIETGPGDPAPAAMTICFVGDGYTVREGGFFIDACNRAADAVAALGLSERIKFVALFRPSAGSGTDYAAGCHGEPETDVTTVYDTGYGKQGDCEILSGNPEEAWIDQLSVNATHFIGLVNAGDYGASSWGDHAWIPARHPDFVNLLLHEFGHMLGLRDEYDSRLAGQFTNIQSYANVTNTPQAPQWGGTGKIYRNVACQQQPPADHLPANQASHHEIAAFQGASYEACENYRPMATCKMRNIQDQFCTVCLDLMNEYLTAVALTPP